ncbi:TPA: hypothetical protein ACH3X2_006752 [Trebouxia sp. C0005]
MDANSPCQHKGGMVALRLESAILAAETGSGRPDCSRTRSNPLAIQCPGNPTDMRIIKLHTNAVGLLPWWSYEDTTVCSEQACIACSLVAIVPELLACQCQACLGSICLSAYHIVSMDYNSKGCSKHVSCK